MLFKQDIIEIKYEDLDKLEEVDFWLLWGLLGKLLRVASKANVAYPHKAIEIEEAKTRICPACGKEFEVEKGQHAKVYCSYECRDNAAINRKGKREEMAQTRVVARCSRCGSNVIYNNDDGDRECSIPRVKAK